MSHLRTQAPINRINAPLGVLKMGDFYEVVELGGDFYLQYQNEKTGWNVTVKKLDAKQVVKLEAFEEQQQEARFAFMCNFSEDA